MSNTVVSVKAVDGCQQEQEHHRKLTNKIFHYRRYKVSWEAFFLFIICRIFILERKHLSCRGE